MKSVVAIAFVSVVAAYAPRVSRRDFGLLTGAAAVTAANPAFAFEGTGSSAYAGKSPTTRAALRKSYQERVAADVKDFNSLGTAIKKGDMDGDAWTFFFTTMPRNKPDAVGRTYAALVDLRGMPIPKSKKFEGGDGYLLANTFTKQGKPPDNTPAVKSFTALSKLFDPILAAGEKKDVAGAKAAWEKASVALSQYLTDVEMPASLGDPLYN